jgi:CRP-like cAMP-binding protein
MSQNNFHIYLTQKAGISEDELTLLPYFPANDTYRKGEYLIRPGNYNSKIFFVEKGLLKQYTIDDNGKEHIMHFAPENRLVSDRSSAYFKQPTEYFIEAMEDTEVFIMDEKFINAASEISATYREFNHRSVHNHIRTMQKRINLLIGASAEKRYLEFVNTYPNLYLRVPQWMIASYLGITPEGLSRVRKELTKKHPKFS